MKNLLLVLFCFTYVLGFSQSPVNKENNTYTINSKIYQLQKDGESSYIVRDGNDTLYWETEVPSEFPGGKNKLIKFLRNNTNYPPEAKAKFISGRVYVHFIISKNGTIEDVMILHKIHPLLDEEALRVVKKLPNWTAGKHDGKNVKMGMSLPISFVLQ